MKTCSFLLSKTKSKQYFTVKLHECLIVFISFFNVGLAFFTVFYHKNFEYYYFENLEIKS